MSRKTGHFILLRNMMGTRFNLIEHIKNIQKIFRYLIFGVLTTVINFCTYSLSLMAGLYYMTGNVVAFVVSVTFAYIVNKKWVFSDLNTQRPNFHESIRFMGCRIFTLGLETTILYILIKRMALDEYGAKVAANIVVIIANYVLSEFVIFQKDKNGDKGNYE